MADIVPAWSTSMQTFSAHPLASKAHRAKIFAFAIPFVEI